MTMAMVGSGLAGATAAAELHEGDATASIGTVRKA